MNEGENLLVHTAIIACHSSTSYETSTWSFLLSIPIYVMEDANANANADAMSQGLPHHHPPSMDHHIIIATNGLHQLSYPFSFPLPLCHCLPQDPKHREGRTGKDDPYFGFTPTTTPTVYGKTKGTSSLFVSIPPSLMYFH